MPANQDSRDLNLLNDLPELLKQIKGNWPVLPSGMWNSSGIRVVLRLLDELNKKCNHLGLVNIHALSVDIERAISDVYEENAQPDDVEVTKLQRLLQDLEQGINAARKIGDQPPQMSSHMDVIYWHRSEAKGDTITAAIEQNGWQIHRLSEYEELPPVLQRQEARVLLVDTAFLPVITPLTDLLSTMRRKKMACPELVFLSAQCDIEVRLEVLRAGATQCLSEPVNINELMSVIKEIVSPRLKPHFRVLIVEDDEAQAKFAAALLQKGGLETLAIINPLNVMGAVHEFQPDLILMDLYMPGANGIELTQVIRNRKSFAFIPIVFLSGEDDPEKKILALHAGADDFLTKPVRPQFLQATVNSRIMRSKQTLAAAEIGLNDATSGLKNRRSLLQDLDMALIQAGQTAGNFGLFSFVINELDTEFDDWSENPLLSRVVDVADVIIGKRDLMARTGRQSFAILINRNDAPQVARFGASLYQQISEELSGKKQDEIRWGIGYVRVMQDTGGAYACLRQSEMAAIQALEGKHPGCLLFEENAQTKQQSQTAQIDLLQEQVRMALKSGYVAFREQLFQTHQHGEAAVIEQIPGFLPKAEVPQEAAEIYQSAERFGFGEVFNRILCRYAIHRIGELQLEGRHDKVSVHLLSSAIEDKSLLDFIQTELRRLQVVGTEMLLEFDLPGLAKNLKVARTFLGEISALGIGVTLSNFACNDTAFKVLAYLNARVVRPHPSLMRTDYDRISKIANQLKAMDVQIILPGMSQSDQISLHWSEVADYVQAEYLD
jgi:DNA-binding response OmpR family regulator/EAL domain-containing protein (putative c-di-GMP-specific phosphodiesterase class I)